MPSHFFPSRVVAQPSIRADALRSVEELSSLAVPARDVTADLRAQIVELREVDVALCVVTKPGNDRRSAVLGDQLVQVQHGRKRVLQPSCHVEDVERFLIQRLRQLLGAPSRHGAPQRAEDEEDIDRATPRVLGRRRLDRL
jgi:hypothetical protein